MVVGLYGTLSERLQDPAEQTKIDNFMVHELDGTVNEWGWCKQKVPYVFLTPERL